MENGNQSKVHIEETKKMLNSMKNVRTIEEIDIDLERFNTSKKREDLIKRHNDITKEFENALIKGEDLTELQQKETDLNNELNELDEFDKKNKENVEKLNKEKEETQKKYDEISNHKKDLEEKKKKTEQEIVDIRDEKYIKAIEVLVVLKTLNKAKDNHLTQEEINEKNDELKKLRLELGEIESKEKSLDAELADVEESLEEIKAFEENPKAYFEKQTKRDKDEKEQVDELEQEDNDNKKNKPEEIKSVKNKPRNKKPRDYTENEEEQVVNEKPIKTGKPQNRVQRENNDQQNISPDDSFTNPNNGDNEPTTINHVEYDSSTNTYHFYNNKGNLVKSSYKEMFIFRLLEERRIYKIYREKGLSRREAIEAVSHLDPNITKQLALMQDNEAQDRYIEYVNGADNDFVNYNFTTFGLIDARAKYADRQRNKIIGMLPEGNGTPVEPVQGQGEPTQGQAEPTQGQGEPVQVQAEPVQGQGEPVQGQGEPTQGQAEPVQVQAEPVQGQTEPVQVQAEPVQGKTDKDNPFDLGEFGSLEVVDLGEEIEVINLDEDKTDNIPADSTPANSTTVNKRAEFLKDLDPNNVDIYSSAKAERSANKARKAAEKARRKEAKRKINEELRSKDNDGSRG